MSKVRLFYDMYRCVWDGSTVAGRVLLAPLFIVSAPLILLIVCCLKT